MKILLFLSALVLLGAFAGASEQELLYWPTCLSPQVIAPPQGTGSTNQGHRSSIAWSGAEYALVWSDADGLLFRRFFADGTPASNPVSIGTPCDSTPAIVWNGSGYAVAMQQWHGLDNKYEIRFALLGPQGNVTYGPATISNSTGNTYFPALAWSGSHYAVVWGDPRNGPYDIYGSLLGADGSIQFSNFSVASAADHQTRPALAWSRSGNRFQAVWMDGRNNPAMDLYGCQISAWGTIENLRQLVAGTPEVRFPSLADSGNGLGLVWSNGTSSSISFCRISANGVTMGASVSVISGQPWADKPQIVWTGAEYGVAWENYDGYGINIWFQRISPSGSLLGAGFQITETTDAEMPSLAFGKYGYLISAGSSYMPFSVWPIGCNWDSTPPTCPGNLLAYNITGTTATVSWLPSTEDFTDIAYYQVYKNNIPLTKTSNNYYNDSGLSPGGTYNYSMRPVNAAQMENGACNSSVYVKANASLVLKMDKSTPDAHLFWTDGGMNNYNVFRGTSPQVMTLIDNTSGQETQDPNVLLDGVTYFYTVDDPVQ